MLHGEGDKVVPTQEYETGLKWFQDQGATVSATLNDFAHTFANSLPETETNPYKSCQVDGMNNCQFD